MLPLTFLYRHIIWIFDAPIIAAHVSAGVKWIAHNGAGYDQIYVGPSLEHTIKLRNTPGAVDDATTTTALYLAISALRQFSIAGRSLRAGKWKFLTDLGKQQDAEAKTVAIPGWGDRATVCASREAVSYEAGVP